MLKTSREAIHEMAVRLLDQLVASGAVVTLATREKALHALVQALTDELRRDEERVGNARVALTADGLVRPGSPEFEKSLREILDAEYSRLD